MIDRRNVLLSGAALSALAFAGPVRAESASGGAAKLNALFDQFISEDLDRSPIQTTSLGLDVGARASEKSKLDDLSLAAIADDKKRNTDQLARLKAFDRNSVSGLDQVNYDVVLYGLQTGDDADKRYDYGPAGAGAPYILSQLTGSYAFVPDFLDSQHQIETKADADAYLARLEAFAVGLDQECEVVRHDVGLGVVPPDFALAKTLKSISALRDMPAGQSVLAASVARRAKEKNIAGDYQAQAEKIVAEKIYPALDRQIAHVKDMQSHATHDAGVWKLPKGDTYYPDSLIAWATSTMPPAEIHKTGLDIVKESTAKIDVIMRAHGMTKGTVGERLRGMFNDPKFRYPNTDAGKEKLLADLNLKVQAVRAKLPAYFGARPKADVIIKRIPKYTEMTQSGGYYQPGSLDGRRPGSYYINLRDTAEVPSWTLPTLTYHESIPGHHLQLSIQQEAALPLLRKTSFFSAYIEGWALYAEQLADEMGMYADDPFGKIGQLHDQMLRAVRLVIDSGLHAMRWTREESVKYFVDTLGDQEPSAVSEVERYCVWPGQACGYMLGKLTFLRLRDKAKMALGAKFDIHEFHDAVLLSAAVPLSVLEKLVDRYIASKQAS
jgi:uncharacterized protein (DUF885 family)